MTAMPSTVERYPPKPTIFYIPNDTLISMWRRKSQIYLWRQLQWLLSHRLKHEMYTPFPLFCPFLAPLPF